MLEASVAGPSTSESTGDRSPARFALIGSSGFAETFAGPALRDSPVHLAGVLGSAPDRGSRLAERLNADRGYKSIEELTQDESVDAVWIATHDALHAPIALQCIASTKHVLIEKPMATSVTDAINIADAAAQAGVIVRVGFHLRFRPAIRHIARLISSGVLGRVGCIRLHYVVPIQLLGKEPSLLRTSLNGSGGSWAGHGIGSHLLDLLRWLSGEELELEGAVAANHRWQVEAEDGCFMIVRFGEAGVGMISGSYGLQGGPGGAGASLIEVFGTDGWCRADDVLNGKGYVETGSDRVEFHDGVLDPYVAEVADFVGAMRGEPSIGAGTQAGLAVTHILEQVRKGTAARQ